MTTNVKSGLPIKRTTKHRNNQRVNTTLGFGEVTSLGFVEMQGNTKAQGEIKSLIRCATMPVPTFGTISYKTYARFIPTMDIFRNYENLKSELPITTQFGTFTPTKVPQIRKNVLSAMILKYYCKHTIYKVGEVFASSGQHELRFLDAEELETTSQTPGDDTARNKIALFNTYISQLVGDINTEAENPDAPNAKFDDVMGISFEDLIYKNVGNPSQITPENADFETIISNYATENQWGKTSSGTYILYSRLTKRGKLLYRILTSLGWKYSLKNNSYMTILPLLAFYKGYFELFTARNRATEANTYTTTNCFRLTDYIAEHDIQDVIIAECTGQSESEGYEYYRSECLNLVINTLSELSYCYYYTEPNLITAHIATPAIGTKAKQIQTNSPNALTNQLATNRYANGQPYIPTPPNGIITAPSLKLLMKMYVMSNKQTVIGANIRKLIQSLYGYDPETIDGIVYDCGRCSYDLDISMIPSETDTYNPETKTGTGLGEIGGLATGAGNEKNNGVLKWNVNAKTDGYLIFYAVMVPDCGFYQGVDPRLNHGVDGKYSLYLEDFDSQGFEISTKEILMGQRLVQIPQITKDGATISTNERTENVAFGFIPQKMTYKMLAQDINNGDLTRRPYHNQLRAYYLGKEITEQTEYVVGKDGNKYTLLYRDVESIPIATPELRAVGKWNWLDNFNKVWYNTGESEWESTEQRFNSFETTFGLDDPFIIHNMNKYDKFDNMKPTSESFETDGEESRSIEQEHA